MDTLNKFEFKRRKYMPVFPKATGKPTIYIAGYPYEDNEPMGATGFHVEQIQTFGEQLSRYFRPEDIYIGVDSFIYYREGDIKKLVGPDVYVVFGVSRIPQRRSFYTWEEGAVPAAVFEFLSDSTANRDRNQKVQLYLVDIGVEEYFIHQPELKKPAEFRGWRRGLSGGIREIDPDEQGGLFSESLNLWFQWEEQESNVRLLRPYLPDGTPITTSIEEHLLRLEAQEIAVEAEARVVEAQEIAVEAQEIAVTEAERRREAETLAREEAQRRLKAEAELEQLRTQLANRQNEGA